MLYTTTEDYVLVSQSIRAGADHLQPPPDPPWR